MTTASAPHFSIFNPEISYQHREFYERIISELNGIFPICNQGKCTAVEISENATEQEQITDLMKKVENFSHQLLDVSKHLFDQFYLAKENFARAIHSNTAYIKVNLIDRNLLERTCDVRWWAMEMAFCECIALANEVEERMNALRPLCDRAEASAAQRTLSDCIEMHVTACLQEEAMAVLQDALAALAQEAGADKALQEAAKELPEQLRLLQKKAVFACDRLEDINNSYTLYRDLVITTRSGRILANSNRQRRSAVLGLDVSQEAWFAPAMQTHDGGEYHAQDLTRSAVEEDEQSLIYATAVRTNADTTGAVIGSMAVFFDFQGEAQMILEDFLPRHATGVIQDGWFSFFSDSQGRVIASSDPLAIPPGSNARFPRGHRALSKGQRTDSYMIFEGLESAVFSAKTDGYLEYPGLGWSSHSIIPKEVIFASNFSSEESLISPEDLMESSLIPDINKETYLKVEEDKESIQLISLNGIVFASKLGKRGVALGPIFDQITRTGDFATSMMEKLLAEMAVGELHLNLQALANAAKQAIDILDRNLFERSADIRWWATDAYFWKALEEASEESYDAASRRLKVINSSYTMYRNLILSDANGDIIACSKLELRNELRKINVSDQEWFQLGMRTTRSTDYGVQDVCDSPLEKNKERSLIYVGGVRAGGAREGESIGVLGICFDWDTEAGAILRTCLPHDAQGEISSGSIAFYTNKQGEIIETSDPGIFPVGSKPALPPEHRSLAAGASASGVLELQQRRYLIGSARTQGYREYAGQEWSAHMLKPLDACNES